MTATRWTGRGHTLSWFTPGNWSAGVPLAQQVTRFSDGHAWTISLAGAQAAQAGSTTVFGDALTFTGGTLALDAAQPSSGNPTDLIVGGGGSVAIARGATIDAQNTVVVGSAVAGSLTAGSIAVAGTLDVSILDVAAGAVHATGHIALQGGGYFADVSNGTLSVSTGGTLDAGPDSLQNQYASLDIGNNGGTALAVFAGHDTMLALYGVTVGDQGTGTLAIDAGATARIDYLDTGIYGASLISVRGHGSSLQVTGGITIGNYTSLSGLTLSITNGGAVSSGTFGLALYYGTLILDPTATLTGSIYSAVGTIEAAGHAASQPGTVTIGQTLQLNINGGAQGQFNSATTLFSTGGAVLQVTGQITAENDATISATSGSVVLLNAADSYASTSLGHAHLEIGASGAAGAGAITFTAHGGGTLQLDPGVALPNIIAGFNANDTIDLRGFAFGAGVTDSFAAGTLSVADGSASASLVFAGLDASTAFAFANDQHGGIIITLPHG